MASDCGTSAAVLNAEGMACIQHVSLPQRSNIQIIDVCTDPSPSMCESFVKYPKGFPQTIGICAWIFRSHLVLSLAFSHFYGRSLVKQQGDRVKKRGMERRKVAKITQYAFFSEKSSEQLKKDEITSSFLFLSLQSLKNGIKT